MLCTFRVKGAGRVSPAPFPQGFDRVGAVHVQLVAHG